MEILNNILDVFNQIALDTIIDRIQTGNGFLITVIGLLAVFSGLLLLWAITANLPLFLKPVQKSHKKEIELKPQRQKPPKNIAIAIGVALCCELEEEEVSVITLRNIEQEMSPWVMASRQSTMRQS